MKKCLFILLFLLLATESIAAKWSFVAIGDNRSAYSTYRKVLEKIQDLNESEGQGAPQFIVACGDISPLKKNHEIFRETFKDSKILYLPVRGNHEEKEDVEFINRHILQAYGSKIKPIGNFGVSYCFDWNEVRLIVLDQYSSSGKNLGNPALIRHLDELITSSRDIKHVFLAFHEPYLPVDPVKDPFWSLMIKHKNKVRGVLCGHYHVYQRRCLPQTDGILYINVGNAGWVSHSDYKQTIIDISVDEKVLRFRAIQAPDGSSDFKVTDQWEIPAN